MFLSFALKGDLVLAASDYGKCSSLHVAETIECGRSRVPKEGKEDFKAEVVFRLNPLDDLQRIPSLFVGIR